MLLTGWILASVAVAEAAPTSQRIDAMKQAWSQVDSYCSDFALGFHSESGSTLSRGERCWDRQGRIRTETQATDGTIVEVRTESDFWYSNPSRPDVLHVTAAARSYETDPQVGQGLGEIVDLVAQSSSVEDMGTVRLNGQETWRFLVSRPNGTVAVVFVDAQSRLPVALELRQHNRAIMSYGLMNLTVDPVLPTNFFSIEPQRGQRLVELSLDPGSPNFEDTLRTLQAWRRP